VARFLGAAGRSAASDYARQRVGVESRRIGPTRGWCSSSRPSWPAPSAAPRPGSWWPRWCEEDALGLDDVLRILDEASQLRAYSHALEDKSRSLEQATAELRAANEQLKSLDRLKDDFMSVGDARAAHAADLASARWPS
jgi:hypothetical protein